MGRPRRSRGSRGGRGGGKRFHSTSFTSDDRAFLSPKPEPKRFTEEANAAEMSTHDDGQHNQTLQSENQENQAPRTPSPIPSTSASCQRRLTDTPGPNPDGSYEYFERGITDQSNPLDENNDSSLQSEMEREILNIRTVKFSRSRRVSTPGVAQPKSPSPESEHIIPQKKIKISTPEVFIQNPIPEDMDVGTGGEEAAAVSGQSSTKDEEMLDAVGEIERKSREIQSGSAPEGHTPRSPGTAGAEDVCGHGRGEQLLPSPSTSGAASTISSESEFRALGSPCHCPSTHSPSPRPPSVSFESVSSNIFAPFAGAGAVDEEGEASLGMDEQREFGPEEPVHERSIQPSAEDVELKRITKACRRMFEHEWEGIAKDKHRVITPLQWTKFRQAVLQFGSLNWKNDLLLRGGNTDEGLVLCRVSTSKPVCSFPSCFSSEGTTPHANTRCVEHQGNKTSYAVLELVFYEEVQGRIAVGIDHVLLMFSHYRTDSNEILLQRAVEEYKNGGLLEDTARRLKKRKLGRSAESLLATKAVSVRRHWIFGAAEAEVSSNHFYKVALAAKIVYNRLNREVEAERVPHGHFRGRHLVVVTRSFFGEVMMSQADEVNLYKEVNLEQFLNYGICTSVFELLDNQRRCRNCWGYH